MMKKKAQQAKKLVFINGGNMPDGTRFEAGDVVPSGLRPEVIKSLRDNKCIDAIELDERADSNIEDGK